MEGTTPFRPSDQAERESNSLHMDISVWHTELFRRDKQREGKALVLDVTVVNPCVSSNLDKEAKGAASAIEAAVRRKTNK